MWKDHTNVYEAFRRSYRATIIPLNKNNASSKAVFENEVYTRLAPDEDEALELETMSPGHSTFASRTWGPPSPIVGRWLQAYVEFQGFLENLTNAIERLSSEYQRHTIDWTRRWQEEGGGGGPSATGESSITDHLFGQVTGVSDQQKVSLLNRP